MVKVFKYCIQISDQSSYRSYNDTARFVEWLDPTLEVPEVALCDEILINNEPDYANAKDKINKLKVGESCIVNEGECIITRVK